VVVPLTCSTVVLLPMWIRGVSAGDVEAHDRPSAALISVAALIQPILSQGWVTKDPIVLPDAGSAFE